MDSQLELKNQINMTFDSSFLSKLSFFNNPITLPVEFFNWTSKQRDLYHRQVLSQANDTPSKLGQWIWFGSYTKDSNQPRYNNESVVRILYNGLVKPIEGGNLRSYFASTKADVNPYKYFPKLNRMSRTELMQEYKDLTGADPIHAIEGKNKEKYQQDVLRCLKDIEDYYTPEVCDTKKRMKEVLSISYPEIVIDAAIEQTKVTLI